MLMQDPLEKKLKTKKPLYSKTEALVEANRCLYCYDAPCIKACPTSIDIPGFIKAIAGDRVDQSARVILRDNILGHSCAQVCPVEVLCAGSCVMHHRHEAPIQIGRLQHYATHHALIEQSLADLLGREKLVSPKKVACIGAGPASLALAGLLNLKGHAIEIFEARAFAGGLNSTGIAPYKMHFEEAQREVQWLRDLGVVIHENTPIKSAMTLLDQFDALFLGLGIGDDTMLPQLPPAHARIYGATDLIRRIKIDPTLSLDRIRSAHVIGGGNTAIDIARELALLGIPEVTMIYRGPKEAMTAYHHELEAGYKEGVRVLANHQPTSIETLSENRLRIHFQDKSLDSDLLVLAIGQARNLDVLKSLPQVELNARGLVIVDDQQRTKNKKVWAGGDCTSGGKEVVNAVADAKIAAASIHDFLSSLPMEHAHG